MKHYDALTCYADRNTLDVITAVSGSLPITGILDNDSHITLYFDEGCFHEEIIDTIRSWTPEHATIAFERGTVEEQNWNAEFEESLEPVRLAEGLVITQSWNPVDAADDAELVVTIDPKMSFGTGHHESTRLIARLMMRLDFSGRRVLDVGCGTGVLAIVAAKRGAAHVVALDNNEWAAGNTLENVALNAVPGIVVIHGDLADLDETGFDVILANIHRNVIIEMLPQLRALLKVHPDARLLTSGVLTVDHESLVEAAREHGFTPVDSEQENEWTATEFRITSDE